MKSFKEFVQTLEEALKRQKDDPCWKGYVQLGSKQKGDKKVPNCVPVEKKE